MHYTVSTNVTIIESTIKSQFDIVMFHVNVAVEVLQRQHVKFPTYVPSQAPPQLKSFTIAPI